MNKILYILLIVSLASCRTYSNREDLIKNELKSKIGRELILSGNPQLKVNSKYRIVSFINGNCSSCVEELSLWENFIEDVYAKDSVDMIFYVASSSFDYLKSHYSFFTNKKITIIHDVNNEFFNTNDLNPNKQFHSVIINRNNKILLVGNPILNQKVKTLYLDFVDNKILK